MNGFISMQAPLAGLRELLKKKKRKYMMLGGLCWSGAQGEGKGGGGGRVEGKCDH